MKTLSKKPYACGLCSKDFSVPRLLVKHVSTAHQPPSTSNKFQPNVHPKVQDEERFAIDNNRKFQPCSKDDVKMKEDPIKVSQADTNPIKVEKDTCAKNSDQRRDQEKDKLVQGNLVQDNLVQGNLV